MVALLNGKKANRRAGFSLVEVAMSLAIVGFACVALVGMLPMGLVSFHQAMGNTIESDIVQDLSNDMLLANFSELYEYSYANSTTPANQVYYYDNEGTPILTTTPAVVPTGTVYTAVVTLTPITSGTSSSTTSSPLGLAANGVSTTAPPTTSSGSAWTAWNGNFSALDPTSNPGLTSAYNVTVTIASLPSTAAYTTNTGFTSLAAYLSAYASNTGTARSQTTRAPDQFSFIIANNNQ